MDKILCPEDPVSRIPGIGPRKQERLAILGIGTVGALLANYPYRYKDRRNPVPALSCSTDRPALIVGTLIRKHTRRLGGGRTVTELVLNDRSGNFAAAFFGMPYLEKNVNIGSSYALFGKPVIRAGKPVWYNPEITEEGSDKDIRGMIPVYHLTTGLTNNDMNKYIRYALENTCLDEWLPEEMTTERNVCYPEYALNNIHFPKGEKQYNSARYRLIYEELLIYQLVMRLNRKQIDEAEEDSSIAEIPISPFLEMLPFELTDGQKNALSDIQRDLSSAKPMNRLIQGDVGCGKTVVAEAAMYRVAKSGKQAAYMAPTEVLARQHYRKISEHFERLGIKTALLVSGLRAVERRDLTERIANGDISVVIGTHAIIQEDIAFNDLGLVITDEQHRFGVNQRKALASKGSGVNVCVMSATPIPRTLAATVFGDMDFSMIRTAPSNRKTVITKAFDCSAREKAYAAAEKELEAGNLVYVVAPSIDSEDDDISSVTKLYEELCRKFSGYRVGLIHGRLSKEEKESIMNDFSSGKIRMLVATVVIEVGIDVPDATGIIIENSERFGLAQMHQLRGRVGRSDKQSYCWLICCSRSETARERAKAMAEISDGFEIAEEDFRLRGPGDIHGTMQHGSYHSHIVDLCRYEDILAAATEDAKLLAENKEYIDNEEIGRRMELLLGGDNRNVI